MFASDLSMTVSPTPSLRGNVPQSPALAPWRAYSTCLQPLRCGAMFLSRMFLDGTTWAERWSPTPSLRGNVPQSQAVHAHHRPRPRSPTPSLRGNVPQMRTQRTTPTRKVCLQPLRCGAMFLSERQSCSSVCSPRSPTPSLRGNVPQPNSDKTPESTPTASLQPLRCGAMFLRIVLV